MELLFFSLLKQPFKAFFYEVKSPKTVLKGTKKKPSFGLFFSYHVTALLNPQLRLEVSKLLGIRHLILLGFLGGLWEGEVVSWGSPLWESCLKDCNRERG